MKKSGLIEMYANAMKDEEHAFFKAISVRKKRNECQACPTILEASEFLQRCEKSTKMKMVPNAAQILSRQMEYCRP